MTDKQTPTDAAAPECLTCSDHGAVGNILTAEPCPDCTRWNVQPALATQPAQAQAQAGAVPLTDKQIKALMQAHRTAMLMTCKARVPECGEFAAIAQDLDWLCESFGIKGGQHAE